MRWPGFVGPSYRSQSLVASAERLVNWYPEAVQTEGAKTRVGFYPTPGVRAFAAAPAVGGRGLFAQAGRCFVVCGAALHEVQSGRTTISRGTVDVDQYPATLVTNGDGGGELFVTSGKQGYVLTLATNVLTSEVANATMGDMLNGYFLRFDIASSTLGISDLLDGTTWDPTQIAQRSIAPDPWRAMIVANQRVWLLGEETTEVWYDAGTSPFPLAAVTGLVIPYGIRAPFSLRRVGSSLMWISQTTNGDAIVVEGQGYDPQRVSTFAVEYAWSRYGRIDDAVGFSYQQLGHTFYEVNFPSANATWVYDQTMGLWHERGHWNTTLSRYEAWGPQFHAFAFGTHLVLDFRTGAILELTPDAFTDVGGAVMRRERIPPALFAEHKRLFVDAFEVYLESGLGLVSGQGSDPQVMLSWSPDGGKTFGAEHWRTAGALGAYSTRVRWLRQGSGVDLVPKLVCSDPIGWRLIDAFATVREGTA